jgi:hypothetical protein
MTQPTETETDMRALFEEAGLDWTAYANGSPMASIIYDLTCALFRRHAAGQGSAVDPDLCRIGPGHICKHGIRWPHPCDHCDAHPPKEPT